MSRSIKRRAVVRTPKITVAPIDIPISDQMASNLEQIGVELRKIRDAGLPEAARQMALAFTRYLESK
jgi:hypothetical protein